MKKMKITYCKNAATGRAPFPHPHTASSSSHLPETWEISVGNIFTQKLVQVTLEDGLCVCLQEDVQVHTDSSLHQWHTVGCVCVFVHPSGAGAAAGHCWQQNLQDVQGRSLA